MSEKLHVEIDDKKSEKNGKTGDKPVTSAELQASIDPLANALNNFVGLAGEAGERLKRAEKMVEDMSSNMNKIGAIGAHFAGDHKMARKLSGEKEPEGYVDRATTYVKDVAVNSPVNGLEAALAGAIGTMVTDVALTAAKAAISDSIPTFGFTERIMDSWNGKKKR